MSPVPLPVRVAVGLAATTVERVLDLPRQVIGLPVTAVSRAVQAGMRVQSRVTELAIRGDAVFAAFRPVEDTPPWARFDEDQPASDGADRRPAAPVLPGPGSPERTGAADTGGYGTGGGYGTTTTGTGAGADEAASAVAAAAANAAAAAAAAAAPTPDLGERVDEGEVDEGDVAKALAGGHDEPRDQARPAPPTGSTGAAANGRERPEHHGRGEPDVRVVPKPGQTPSSDAPPLPGYDELSLAQLRGRLRTLSAGQLEELLEHERTHRDRPPFVTMLSNRITTVRAQ